MVERASVLRELKVCRFCLCSDENKLTNIYSNNISRDARQSVPLTVQIMACVTIEVFPSDGMPQLICQECRQNMMQSYIFKTNCKKADDALKQFLISGQMSKPYMKPLRSKQRGKPESPTPRRTFKITRVESANQPTTKTIKLQDGSEIVNLQFTNVSNDEDSEMLVREGENENETILGIEEGVQEEFADNENEEEDSLQEAPAKKKSFTQGERSSGKQPSSEGQKHIRHRNNKDYTCTTCNKSFVFKQGLERHLISHASEKPHKCNYCEARFNSAIKLTRHITSHDGLRPYPCKVCSRTFLLSHHLTRHMRSHFATQAKNFEETLGQHKCDLCSMSFRRKDSLINHSAIHSMVNLRCVICNTTFDNAKAVKAHITSHLAGLPYPCEKCDYSFETSEQLEEHELKHAEMEYEEQIEKEVVAEAKKQMSADEDTEEDEFDEAAETEEFTITTDDGNTEEEYSVSVAKNKDKRGPTKEVVQPSEVGFLKSEIDSEPEDEPMTIEEHEPQPRETLKPIVRSEGTKVYQRKKVARKIPQVKVPNVSNSKTTDSNIDNGQSRQLIDPSILVNQPPSQFVSMKVGQKIVRVQKFVMTKEKAKEMAKQGIIEVRDGHVMLRSTNQTLINASLKPIQRSEIETLIKSQPQVKQYTGPTRIDHPSESESLVLNEPFSQTSEINLHFDGIPSTLE